MDEKSDQKSCNPNSGCCSPIEASCAIEGSIVRRDFFKFLGIDYIYSLTFRPEGRLDWRQALFLKLVGDNDQQIELLKK